MITLTSPYFYNKPNVNFKCYSGFTDINVKGKEGRVNNYTTFFRNYPTLDFTKNYLVETFPQGTDITEFGCSTGQKAFSLMITLDKHNKDKKYKMTGYDFPEVIKKTNEANLYGLNSYMAEEQVLFDEYKDSQLFDNKYIEPKKAQELQETFFQYFDKFKTKYYVTGERYNYLKKIVKANPDSTSQEIKDAKEEILYSDMLHKYTSIVKANEKAKNLVEFKSGDINDIDKILKPKKSGAVIFQNALYHILSDNNLDYEIDDLVKNVYKAEALFKKINKVLPQNGIFVLGSLPSDHIYDFDREEDTHLLYQNNKQIRVYDSSPIHVALRKNGFVPIFYENSPDSTGYVKYREVYLPSVWKKVRDI